MHCEDFDNLADEFLEDALDRGAAARFQRHLDSCALCADRMREELAFRELLAANLAAPAPLQNRSARVMARVQPPRARPRGAAALALAGAFMLIAGGVWMSARQPAGAGARPAGQPASPAWRLSYGAARVRDSAGRWESTVSPGENRPIRTGPGRCSFAIGGGRRVVCEDGALISVLPGELGMRVLLGECRLSAEPGGGALAVQTPDGRFVLRDGGEFVVRVEYVSRFGTDLFTVSKEEAMMKLMSGKMPALALVTAVVLGGEVGVRTAGGQERRGRQGDRIEVLEGKVRVLSKKVEQLNRQVHELRRRLDERGPRGDGPRVWVREGGGDRPRMTIRRRIRVQREGFDIPDEAREMAHRMHELEREYEDYTRENGEENRRARQMRRAHDEMEEEIRKRLEESGIPEDAIDRLLEGGPDGERRMIIIEERDGRHRPRGGPGHEIRRLHGELEELVQQHDRIVRGRGEDDPEARDLERRIDELEGAIRDREENLRREIEQLDGLLDRLHEELDRAIEQNGEDSREAERLRRKIEEVERALAERGPHDLDEPGDEGRDFDHRGRELEDFERNIEHMRRKLDAMIDELGEDHPRVRDMREEIGNMERELEHGRRELERDARDRGRDGLEEENARLREELDRLLGERRGDRGPRGDRPPRERPDDLDRELRDLFEGDDGPKGDR